MPTTPIFTSLFALSLLCVCSFTCAHLYYSGFGNAAGLIAQYGLMKGQRSASTVYSDDSDSETDEYKELEPNINPVTGMIVCLQS